MALRRNLQSFEAKLTDPATGAVRGKAEREQYVNGISGILRPGRAERFDAFELRLRGVSIPDGTAVQICVNDKEFGRVPIQDGFVQFTLRTDRSQSVPHVRAGDRITITANDTLLAQGTFAVD